MRYFWIKRSFLIRAHTEKGALRNLNDKTRGVKGLEDFLTTEVKEDLEEYYFNLPI